MPTMIVYVTPAMKIVPLPNGGVRLIKWAWGAHNMRLIRKVTLHDSAALARQRRERHAMAVCARRLARTERRQRRAFNRRCELLGKVRPVGEFFYFTFPDGRQYKWSACVFGQQGVA